MKRTIFLKIFFVYLIVALILSLSLFLIFFQRVSLFVKALESLVLIVFLSFLVAIFFYRNIRKPIKYLINAYRMVADGDYSARILFKKEDDIRELGDSFNYMTSQIKKMFDKFSQQKETLNTIISSVPVGIFLLDREGKISSVNKSFKNLFKDKKVKGRFYWEVFREPKFIDLIRQVKKKQQSSSAEVYFREKIFLCNAVFLTSQRKIIGVLHDISETKALKEIKKDFVSSVSHELRTPLTAIKGYVETLKDENLKKKEYLEIIGSHTNRLISIVEDLLVLSKLENEEPKLEMKEINLRHLVKDVVNIFENKLKEKRLSAVIQPGKDITIMGDNFQLEQVFINIIDNAVKYTEKGEIRIGLSQENQEVRIEIEDTGEGIPEKHLSRIFERFYVVDKSRSRKLGGTGLGLSIVKHIVSLHNGSIDVQSKIGVGTKFTILLPCSPS